MEWYVSRSMRRPTLVAAFGLLFVPSSAFAQPHLALGSPSAQRAGDSHGSPSLALGVPSSEAARSPEPDYAALHPFALEVEHGLTLTPNTTLSLGSFSFQLRLSYRIADHVALGIGDFGFFFGSDSSGNVFFGASATPYVEAFTFVDPHVQLFTDVGAHIIVRTDTPWASGGVDVAIDLRSGVRFWIRDWLTIGLELGLSVVATDTYSYAPVSRGALIGYFGTTVGFHF